MNDGRVPSRAFSPSARVFILFSVDVNYDNQAHLFSLFVSFLAYSPTLLRACFVSQGIPAEVHMG